MCGVAGIVGRWPEVGDPIDLFTRVIRHRGPDDYGALTLGKTLRVGRDLAPDPDASCVLVHRRLSIIDLTQAGWQPMSTPDGRFHLAFNGEIYNYVELRRELEAKGVPFQSQSDSEVLLHLLAREGEAALPRLVGMFALALLDAQKRRVLLARDFFGIKPLYTARGEEAVAFCSEIKGLLALPGVGRHANPRRLGPYLRFGATDHGEETMFEAVRQIPAGGYQWIGLDGRPESEPRRYWKPERHAFDVGFEEAARTLRDLFVESVDLHLRSDVPVGCCLSGGIDSSAVVCAMREVGGPALQIHAFSHIASTPELSEERWIDLAGQAAGAQVHKVRPRAEELACELDDLVASQDEPFGSTSIYAQRRVMRLVGETGIKVVLDGQGADELLAGYDFYLGARIAGLLRRGRVVSAWRLARRAQHLRGVSARWQAQNAMDYLLPGALNALGRRMAGKDLAPDWLDDRWLAERGGGVQGLRSAGDLGEALVQSVGGPGLPQLLRYEDRNSMAYSIESRVPFLTPRLAQFCLGLPAEALIGPDGTSKHVFRRAMRGIVPDAILDRRDKIGFATPEADWLRSVAPWVSEQLESEAARSIPVLRHEAMRSEWAAIVAGSRRYNPGVWRWVNLIAWTRQLDVRYR